MKKLTCEMCGSTNLVKQEGMYICQSCSTKYSVEEAKKMMIEGTVDVSGSTVRVDVSRELKNLYEIARRAKNDNNSENAQKYYDQILAKDPNSWEANFYTVYYQSMNCKIAGIQNAAIMLSNCEDTVLQLIKDHVNDPEDRKKAVEEVAARLITISRMLFNAAKNHYDGISIQIKSNYTQEYINNCWAAIDIVYNFGNYTIQFFEDQYGKDVSVPCWKAGIEGHTVLMPNFADKETHKNIITEYERKINIY